ncbi:Major facilitator superfamily transporter [Pleurostoma richardsiae]|uniref:Major facilitator superfamily transporter n=1 Tax=Pleurostoma richardsiae TaxID=41990 RepID=A0AA38S7V2_9PEZI|nr:Major facilitator superfamily transporter [Pleurostoma richardsiae]
MSIDQTPSDRSVAAVDLDAKIQAEHSDFAIEKAREPDDHDMTPEEEARMVRKLDLHIFPILICLYILSFLDRVNIGNARLYHLERDLGLHGNEYQLCVSMLFVTYVTFELPTNLVLKMVQPKRFIPAISIGWGIVSMCTGFVQNKGQLIAMRLLLGIFEAGYFPAICFYLTFFYRRRELAVRIFFLFAASAVSGSCGGLIGYAIGHMDGIQGYSAWRWLMILEGIPTTILGCVAYFVLANDPYDAKYLSEREKSFTPVRRRLDGTHLGMEGEKDRIDWQQCLEAWKDWKVWTLATAQIGVTVMLYGYSTFLPTIINALGYSGIHTNLLTIPCYACGAVVYLIVAKLSDRTGYRGYFAVAGCAVACTGYAILLGTPQYGAGAQYAGCIIVACGLYVAVGIPISWMPNNLPSHYKRAAGQGTSMTLGNCAGIFSSFLYRTQDAPRYRLGHGVTLGFVFWSGCMFLMTALLLRRENKKRNRGERDHVLVGKTPEEVARLGDYHPEYRYLY